MGIDSLQSQQYVDKLASFIMYFISLASCYTNYTLEDIFTHLILLTLFTTCYITYTCHGLPYENVLWSLLCWHLFWYIFVVKWNFALYKLACKMANGTFITQETVDKKREIRFAASVNFLIFLFFAFHLCIFCCFYFTVPIVERELEYLLRFM